MPCTEAEFQEMPLDFVRGSQAIMWNNGSLYPIPKAAKCAPPHLTVEQLGMS